MTQSDSKLDLLNSDLSKAKNFFINSLNKKSYSVHIYTHLDSDGLASGAILGKALYRENISFQISILKQLEREEIIKIAENEGINDKFLIFSDFGSGQYLELQDKIPKEIPYIILDHHLPQKVIDKRDNKIKEIYLNSSPWHINPYFFGIDGSNEVSSAGICYCFVKILNKKNIDQSALALVGAVGDIQNQGSNNSFIGLNKLILEDAIKSDLVEILDDLNFSPIKPINEAIAYSSDIVMPGLSGNSSKTLKFLQKLGILTEDSKGNIKTLNDLTQDEKKKISSAIIEYSSLKLDIEPAEIISKLIINRYVLKKELIGSELHDLSDFSNLLNSCGRSNNGSLGIAIAMGDRKMAYKKAQDQLITYKKMISEALCWIQEHNKVNSKEYIQYFFGEDIISENIIGTIASMLIFDKTGIIDKNKPIFGCAKREEDNVYKISARAHEEIVNKGLNLSEVIREALELSEINALGGGHPPAAGSAR
ncbi:MAG: DHH family phosphoesterase [Candidatus Thorarchaeota archaeon]